MRIIRCDWYKSSWCYADRLGIASIRVHFEKPPVEHILILELCFRSLNVEEATKKKKNIQGTKYAVYQRAVTRWFLLGLQEPRKSGR